MLGYIDVYVPMRCGYVWVHTDRYLPMMSGYVWVHADGYVPMRSGCVWVHRRVCLGAHRHRRVRTYEVDVDLGVAHDPVEPLTEHRVVHGRHPPTAGNKYACHHHMIKSGESDSHVARLGKGAGCPVHDNTDDHMTRSTTAVKLKTSHSDC